MGCNMLEFLIWLMYDMKELERLNRELRTDLFPYSPFNELQRDKGRKRIAVAHQVVVRWMDHMGKGAACRKGETALGKLLEIFRTCLLVVKLPEGLSRTTSLSPGAVQSPQPHQTIPVLLPNQCQLQERKQTVSEPASVLQPHQRRLSHYPNAPQNKCFTGSSRSECWKYLVRTNLRRTGCSASSVLREDPALPDLIQTYGQARDRRLSPQPVRLR